MTASKSLRLYELTLEFIKNKDLAKEYVDRIEALVEDKLIEKENLFATKNDLLPISVAIISLKAEIKAGISEAKLDIVKWMIATAIAIIGLNAAIEKLF